MLDETRLEGISLYTSDVAVKALIETQVILQLMVSKGIVASSEVAATREIVRRQPKYKMMLQALEEATNRNDESKKFEDLMRRQLQPNGREQLSQEEKDYLLKKLDNIARGK